MSWIQEMAAPRFMECRPARALEVGSLDVNGSARSVLRKFCGEWLGVDRQAGAGVDWVGELCDLTERRWADAVICTEALEHDSHFWETLDHMDRLSAPGALWVVTTPANGFPYHGWPNDYYRFTEDAYRDVIFAGMEILDLRTIDGGGHERAVCGMAVHAKSS